MIILHEAAALENYLGKKRKEGATIGFVPTMGALHEGHLALLKTAVEAGNYSVASIFVNPTQFNDPKDFEKYPVTIEEDIRLLEENGCNLLFLPSVNEIYPNGTTNPEHYDLGELETVWEGYYRPGHFQGVCQVVDRLLQLTHPDFLYMGLKDYQQCMVIKRLLELKPVHSGTALVPCPTLREDDGLAMSSRNRRLNEKERQLAPLLFQTLQHISRELNPGPVDLLFNRYRDKLTNAGFRLDYLALAHAKSLEEIKDWDGKEKAVILLAAFNGEVRLIDNLAVPTP